MIPLLLLAVFIAIGAVLIWWLLVATEGVYLGRRVVVWLYDVYARRYDSIKAYAEDWEQYTLAEPILGMLEGIDKPLILDVATGTGRLPDTVLTAADFSGQIIGLDASRRMLDIAAHKLNTDRRVSFTLGEAGALPFAAETFDLVSCLEALEFVPDRHRALRELCRVLRPGGILVVTNRKGWQRWLYPGRTGSTPRFVRQLRETFGLESVTPTLWQLDYDLIWAEKPAAAAGAKTVVK